MIPIGSSILVRPYYDPDRISTGLSGDAPGLWIPDEIKDPMSHHGLVLEVGPQQEEVSPGEIVVYRPWLGHPWQVGDREVLLIKDPNIIGWLGPATGDLYPRLGHVVIRPIFPERRPVKKGSLWLPRVEDTYPTTGYVEIVARDVETVEIGDKVVFDFASGFEVGLKKVYYVIREDDLLATVEGECLKF